MSTASDTGGNEHGAATGQRANQEVDGGPDQKRPGTVHGGGTRTVAAGGLSDEEINESVRDRGGDVPRYVADRVKRTFRIISPEEIGSASPWPPAEPPDQTLAEIKACVRYRDGFRCRLCGISAKEHCRQTGKNLQVHRILPGSAYCVDGCLTLCQDCHGPQPKNMLALALALGRSCDDLLALAESMRQRAGVVTFWFCIEMNPAFAHRPQILRLTLHGPRLTPNGLGEPHAWQGPYNTPELAKFAADNAAEELSIGRLRHVQLFRHWPAAAPEGKED
jgi:hypothetical protein